MKYFLTIIVLITGAAQAQPQCTNLIYTGAPFVSLVTSGSNAQSLVPLAGTVTLSTPLPANAQNVAISPTAWQFNSESQNLNSEYTYELIGGTSLPLPVFYFTTDANGNITQWSFTVQWYTTSTPEMTMSATSAAPGDTVEFNLSQPSPVPPQTQASSIVGISSTPGAWTCQPPPVVDPLVAEVAQLQAQVATLETANNNLTGDVNSLKAAYASETTAYTREVAAYNAEVTAYKTELSTVTKLKADLAADAALIAKLETECKK